MIDDTHNDDSHKIDFSTMLENMTTTGLFAVDRRLNVIFWNRFMEIHSQLKAKEIVNNNLARFFPELKEDWFARKIRSVMVLGNQSYTKWTQRPYLLHFPTTQYSVGKINHMFQDCSMWPLKDSSGQVVGVCISVHDVTEMAMAHKLLEEATEHALTFEESSIRDKLTGLYNRKYFYEQLHLDLAKCRKYNWKMVHAILDVDYFKQINDNYGHQVGDDVLIELGKRINTCLRDSDTLCRMGGEEFGILLPNLPDRHARDVLERLRITIEEKPFKIGNLEVPVTVSIGGADFNYDEPPKETINRADKALYLAKENGRNRVELIHG